MSSPPREIFEGIRGGKYWINSSGKKVYLKSKKSEKSKKSKKSNLAKVESPPPDLTLTKDGWVKREKRVRNPQIVFPEYEKLYDLDDANEIYEDVTKLMKLPEDQIWRKVLEEMYSHPEYMWMNTLLLALIDKFNVRIAPEYFK